MSHTTDNQEAEEDVREIATLLWWLSLIAAIIFNSFIAVNFGWRAFFAMIAANVCGLVGGMSSVLKTKRKV